MSQDAARRAVRNAIDARWARGAFADKAKIDPGTLGDFLDGKRWPQGRNRAKIEEALGWPVGSIEDLSEGLPLEQVVGPSREDADFVPTGAGGISGISEDELLRRLDRMRQEQNEIVSELLRRRGGPTSAST